MCESKKSLRKGRNVDSGEGNDKPLLDSNSCLENPLLDLQESEQTRRTITTTTTTTTTTTNISS